LKYPEVLSEDENGRKRVFGGRRQYCFNSQKYIELSSKIVEILAKHYSKEEQVTGWQIDNEFGHEGSDMCFCPICHRGFQDFLKCQYKDISVLNRTYGTAFWSQTYNSFCEIPIPKPTITTHNPSLMLDFYRFRASSISNYAKMQIDILKKYVGERQFITHNFSGGLFDKAMDFKNIGKSLDIVSYDNYPVWGGLKEPVPPYSTALYLDMMRSIKQKNFCVMEQLIGAQGHQIIGYLPRPGQATMWTLQSIAHGAESILFFRERAACKGAEQFCYGILDHGNKPGRKYYEVKKFIEHVHNSGFEPTDDINSEIALVYDMDNIWSWKIQPQSRLFDFTKEAERLYAPFFRLNSKVDVVSSDVDFSKYKLLLIPVLMLAKNEISDRIEAFARNGGTVVFSFRAGIKDINNNILFNSENRVESIAGIKIIDFESLHEGQSVEIKDVNSNLIFSSTVWRDLLECTTAQPIFSYNDDFYAKYAAITKNKYGNGIVYYVGTGAESAVVDKIAREIILKNNIAYLSTPNGVEIYSRGEKSFIMNHTPDPISFREIKLAPFEYKITNII